jgi:hypothetical protein
VCGEDKYLDTPESKVWSEKCVTELLAEKKLGWRLKAIGTENSEENVKIFVKTSDKSIRAAGKLSEFKQKRMVKVCTRTVCENVAKAYLVANKMVKRRRTISYGK